MFGVRPGRANPVSSVPRGHSRTSPIENPPLAASQGRVQNLLAKKFVQVQNVVVSGLIPFLTPFLTGENAETLSIKLK